MNGTIPSAFDVGCTVVVPIRITPLAAVCTATYDSNACGHFDDKRFPGHVVNLTLNGRWTLCGRDGHRELEAGDVVVGRAFDRYGCRHPRHTRGNNLLVGLSPGALDSDEAPIFERETVTVPGLERRIRRTLAAQDADAFDSLVFELVDDVARRSHDDERQVGSRIRMQRAKRFIEHHAADPIGLRDIADSIGLSTFHTLRQFRRAFGLTPHDYLARRRLREAMRLLARDRTGIAAVAKAVGFPDAAYFSRFFVRCTGVTPTAYREQENPNVAGAARRNAAHEITCRIRRTGTR